MDDNPVETWKEVAKILSCSKRTAQRRKERLVEAGAIFYKWRRSRGDFMRKVVCAYPSRLKDFTVEKSKRGEIF